MHRAALVIMFLLLASPAAAQSTYVAAAVGVDVFRSAHAEARDIDNLMASGEAAPVL